MKIELLDGPCKGIPVEVGREYAQDLIDREKAREVKTRKEKEVEE
jgi:hypothetical protein